MKEIFIFDGKRTAIGSFGKSLSMCTASDLGTTVVKEILNRNALTGNEIDEVIIGCVLQAGCGQNIARQISIACNIPVTKTSLTINMVCGSSLRAVTLACQAIKSEDADLIISGGTESMSNAPYLINKARFGIKMGNSQLIDSLINDGLWDVFGNYHMGVTAENLAEKYKITRKEQDEFACNSQNKAEKAIKSGRFSEEIIPVRFPETKKKNTQFIEDEFPRFGTTIEKLSLLEPVFKKNGTVTPGNSSGINDGASGILIGNISAAKKYNLKPMARIVSYAYHGTEPGIMGIGPVSAVKKALHKADWKIDDLELIESNEAFAAQAISVNKELAWDKNIVNVNGGAIALGHPIGASGARILVTLLHEMKKNSRKKGLATLCIGGGMGIAVCIEII